MFSFQNKQETKYFNFYNSPQKLFKNNFVTLSTM